MNYILAVYTARESAYALSRKLTSLGIYNEIISTPSDLKVGCGLSVTFEEGNMVAVRRLVQSYKAGFKGFFEQTVYGKQRIY